MAMNMRLARARGMALIEAAIVMPLIFLLVFGVIEYGWLFLKAQQISNACRQGARVGIRPSSDAATITSAVQSALRVNGLDTSGYTLTITPSDPTTLAAGAALTV